MPSTRTIIAALAAATTTALAAPAALAGTAAPIGYAPNNVGAPNEFAMDVNPSAAGAGSQTPDRLSLSLPRATQLDVHSRTAECSPAQAAAIACPKSAYIGFGHAIVHVSGYLMPGGETDAVAYLRAFLGHPVVPGDPASIVIEAELLGVDQLKQALQQKFGYDLPTKSTTTGRVQRLGSGPYAFRVSFAGMPGGFSVPSPVTAQMTRFKLQIGAVNFKRHNFFHKYRVATMHGVQTYKIPDHRLIAHYLLRNPPRCYGSWPFQATFGVGSTNHTYTARAACSRGHAGPIPPPSPSQPERS